MSEDISTHILFWYFRMAKLHKVGNGNAKRIEIFSLSFSIPVWSEGCFYQLKFFEAWDIKLISSTQIYKVLIDTSR